MNNSTMTVNTYPDKSLEIVTESLETVIDLIRAMDGERLSFLSIQLSISMNIVDSSATLTLLGGLNGLLRVYWSKYIRGQGATPSEMNFLANKHRWDEVADIEYAYEMAGGGMEEAAPAFLVDVEAAIRAIMHFVEHGDFNLDDPDVKWVSYREYSAHSGEIFKRVMEQRKESKPSTFN